MIQFALIIGTLLFPHSNNCSVPKCPTMSCPSTTIRFHDGSTNMMKNLLLFLLALLPTLALAATPTVTPLRCPDGGVQPQTAVDSTGKIHLCYLKGEDGMSDIFYVTSTTAGQTWTAPIRVNSQPGAAIATGAVRGAHLAIGKDNRPHVAWMGSMSATPKAPGDSTPMLYTRLNDAGDAFEPQRNLITTAPGLDGGGSVAADSQGNVYVAWHAPIPGQKGEANRTVWLATSNDDGKTFPAESQMLTDPTGACGCCGMRLGIDAQGHLLALYRAANSQTRDIYLLQPTGKSAFKSTMIESLATKTCPMSTGSFTRGNDRELAAWETAGQISFTSVDPKTSQLSNLIPAPGNATNRKHPTLAINKDGFVLLAWAENTGWKKGGNLAWQIYDPSLKPIEDAAGKQRGVVAWSLGAAFANPDGSFTIIY
jgi:hypothetical protein